MGIVGGQATEDLAGNVSNCVLDAAAALQGLKKRQDEGEFKVKYDTQESLESCKEDIEVLLKVIEEFLAAPGTDDDIFFTANNNERLIKNGIDFPEEGDE